LPPSPDFLPAEFRGLTPAQADARWTEWRAKRDAAIRARVEAGVTYMSLPGIGDAGDRVIWYQKR
jgi:hypothetical protein